MQDNQRGWQLDDPDRIVTWQPASPPRAVEGPLALDCFEGSSLVLEMAPEQIACREDDGRLQQVFFGSVHRLEIGMSREQVCPSSRLIFLRPDVPMDLRWTHHACLVLDPAEGKASSEEAAHGSGRSHGLRLALRGGCRLCMADPVVFYKSFLQGLKQPAQDRMLAVLDALIRTQLARHLKPLLSGGDLDRLHAQTLLAELGPAALGEDLDEYGLDCLYLTAHLPLASDGPLMTVPSGSPLAGSYDDLI